MCASIALFAAATLPGVAHQLERALVAKATPKVQPAATPPEQIGDVAPNAVVTLYATDKYRIGCYERAEYVDAMFSSLDNHDTAALHEAIASAKLILLRGGTRVRVIQHVARQSKVEVREGPMDKTCFILNEQMVDFRTLENRKNQLRTEL